MAPQTHTRYRVQRLIRLGEWLERNQDTLVALFDVIDDAHDMLVDPPEDMPTSDIVEITGFKQLQALKGMSRLMTELRHDLPTRNIRCGGDVTIHHPYSCKEQYEVVIKAPVPDVPSQEDYNESLKDKAGVN